MKLYKFFGLSLGLFITSMIICAIFIPIWTSKNIKFIKNFDVCDAEIIWSGYDSDVCEINIDIRTKIEINCYHPTIHVIYFNKTNLVYKIKYYDTFYEKDLVQDYVTKNLKANTILHGYNWHGEYFYMSWDKIIKESIEMQRSIIILNIFSAMLIFFTTTLFSCIYFKEREKIQELIEINPIEMDQQSSSVSFVTQI